MNHVKNAIVYRIALPSPSLLAVHLDELKHTEIQEPEPWKHGFYPVAGFDGSFSLVEQLVPGGGLVAFSVRLDEKIMPTSIINERTKERVKAIAEASGRQGLNKVEKRAIREQVVQEVVKVALVRTSVVTCFYDYESRFLFVPASKRFADVVTNLLIKAVGAAKTETIHVSNVKGGLTTRMRAYIEAREGFDQGFIPNSAVWLKRGSERVTIQLDGDVANASKAISEALEGQFQVTAIRLEHEVTSVSFRLTEDFHLKAIALPDMLVDQDAEDRAGLLRAEMAAQLTLLIRLVQDLCVMFDYKAPEEEAPEPEAEAA